MTEPCDLIQNGNKRIVTAEKSEDGTIFLRITGDNYPIKDGERFKIVSMEDGFQLRSLEAPSGIFERICMDIECDDIFKIMMERYPKYLENTGILQIIIRRSFLYTWMKRLIRKLGVEVEDMQPLLALNQEELDEYKSVIYELTHPQTPNDGKENDA